MEHSKKYEERLPNGTEISIDIKVDVNNFHNDDYRDVFGKFAGCTRKFYLEELKSVVNDNKEAADPAELQSQPRVDTSAVYVSLDTLIRLLSKAIGVTPRYERKLVSDSEQFRYFLKERLGVDLNDFQLYKNVVD